MRDDGSTPSKFYNQEGNIVMADNQSGDFDISVENHEGSRLERRLASFDDKYNILVIKDGKASIKSLLKISLLRGEKKFSV